MKVSPFEETPDYSHIFCWSQVAKLLGTHLCCTVRHGATAKIFSKKEAALVGG
jgi:hypothetical protein